MSQAIAGQAPATGPAPQAVVAGQVLDATAGGSVPGAAVTMTPTGRGGLGPLPDGRSVANPVGLGVRIVTDVNGRFVIRNVPQGRYAILAEASGYAQGLYGQRRVGGPSAILEIGPGDHVIDVKLSLWRLGAIDGAVIDEAGEPMPGVRVRAFRRTTVDGVKRWKETSVSVTDHRGRYRMAELRAGEYLIGVLTVQRTLPASRVAAQPQPTSESASPVTSGSTGFGGPTRTLTGTRIGDFLLATENSGGVSQDGAPLRPMPPLESGGALFVCPPLFYPAASTPEEATILSIASGEERRGVNIHLAPVRSSRVSG
ncbi:MAG TPA: carboxypeptidase-like regulatory domain-containing protein, partial [Vicinamibacterales bacterium]